MLKNLFSRFWKKSDNPYPISFGERLTRRIMLRMLIFMGVPILLLFQGAYYMTNLMVVVLSWQMTKGQYEEVRCVTSEVMSATNNTAPFIEENLGNPDKLFYIMERMVRTNECIRSCGISFIDSSNFANILSGKKYCKTILSVRTNLSMVCRQVLR